MKTRLTNSMRQKTADKLLAATFRERIARYESLEHSLAIRILNRELGEDSLIRIAALPDGWLPIINELKIGNDKVPSMFFRYGGGTPPRSVGPPRACASPSTCACPTSSPRARWNSARSPSLSTSTSPRGAR